MSEVKTGPKPNGLSTWRKRVAEDKEKKMEELEELRQTATTVKRDGQEFLVVTIPDKYTWGE
jgi:hypothetical protein